MQKICKMLFILLIAFLLSGCSTDDPVIKEQYHTVIFYDADGSILLNQQVQHGQSAIAPNDPSIEGFRFIGWDFDFLIVTQPMIITALYEPVEQTVYYQVIFTDNDGIVYAEETVVAGESVTPPSNPKKENYTFVGWDQETTNVTQNLRVIAIFERNQEPITLIEYASYIEDRQYKTIGDLSTLVKNINFETSHFLTITNIFYGYFREANQIHYYEAANYRSRNVYGYEVAVDANGVVIAKATLVDLPEGGFILSGHTNTATYLEENLEIGDIIIYENGVALCFRDETISKMIALHIAIHQAIDETELAFEQLLALNYVALINRINDAIDLYGQLSNYFFQSKWTEANNLLLEVAYLLIEGRAVSTKAFWHYPLRLPLYPETNLLGVQALLDQVAYTGFNTIYINTNFNGSSIYPSQHLPQRLTNDYTYGPYKDYLECFIAEAHERGLTVIAWTNTLIIGDGSISSTYVNRGWVLKDYFGGQSFNGMHFIDISLPEAQTFLADVFRELAAYNLDGIEFDFIRFPTSNLYSFTGVITDPSVIRDSGYTESFIQSFMETFDLTGNFHTMILESKVIRDQWITYKREMLNDTVKMLVDVINGVRSDILITAAVMSNSTMAYNAYLQDWNYWLDQGWIDVLEPMIYNGDTNYVLTALESHRNVVNHRADIVVGLYPEGSGGTNKTTAEQIRRIQELYPYGWSKFSGRTIFSNLALMESYHLMSRHYTVRPNADKLDIIKAYMLDLYDKVENFYRFADLDSNYESLSNIILNAINNQTFNYLVFDALYSDINAIEEPLIKERLLNQWHYVNALLTK